MLQKAKARGANLFELFSNSPMWWMCVNHNPSGSTTGITNNLQSWNNQTHALYLATIAKYAQDNWGIKFTSVEAFNEPLSIWWDALGNQEGCHFQRDTQATVIQYLRQELNSLGLSSVIVSASDENTYDEALATWQSFSSAVQADVGRVNTHGYQYHNGRRDFLYNAVSSAKKKLWNSEYGEGDASGLSLASNLNLDFRWLHNTAWVYWQPFDQGGWGFVDADINTPSIGKPNTKYYVFAQYSRHIRPGMTIIDGGEANTVAAYDKSNRKLVVITTNYDVAQWITYDLSGFSMARGPITRWETRIDGSVLYVVANDTEMRGSGFQGWFESHTIQTFEVSNVFL